jgi:hypothetical protein
MMRLRQAGIAVVLVALLLTGVDASALETLVAAWSSGWDAPTALEARLPACCRRHGNHHCPMMDGGDANSRVGVDAHRARVHSVCGCCQDGAARAMTSATAWMSGAMVLDVRASAEALRSVCRERRARSVKGRQWRDRGPPMSL